MKATIITIGDEILIGQIIDTNSTHIAKSLDKIGIQTHEIISISDDKQHILDTLQKLQNKVDIVIITGGLGPTKDDVTKKTFCEYFNDTLVQNDEVLENVTYLINKVLKRSLNQTNKDQALVPSRALVLHNAVGTAPGMWMEHEKTIFVSLPGVPYEMKYLMEKQVIPNLISKFERPFIIHKTILTYGEGESVIADRIESFENNLPTFIKLAYLPSPGRVRLRLTARGTNEQVLKDEMDRQVEKLEKIISDIIVGYEDDEPIEAIVGKLLTEKKYTLSTAESFTGGKIASVITSVSGASNYFKGSIVSYATEVKENILQIEKQLIEQKSVVSAEVAIQMAEQVKKILKTDFSIATTGVAGPNKGETEAEIGTVFIAIATPTETLCEEHNFGQPREKVVNRAVNKGLEMVFKYLRNQ